MRNGWQVGAASIVFWALVFWTWNASPLSATEHRFGVFPWDGGGEGSGQKERPSLNGHSKDEHRKKWREASSADPDGEGADEWSRRRVTGRYPKRPTGRRHRARDDKARFDHDHDHDADSHRHHGDWDDDDWEEILHERLRFSDMDRTDGIAFRSSFGFTLGPDTFLMTADASYFVTHEQSIGPLFQLGLSDDDFLLGATLNFKRTRDIILSEDEENLEVNRFKPFVNYGIGILFLDEDQRGGRDDDDAGLLLNVGFGFDVYISDRVSFGSGVLFNFMPSAVLDEHFFFAWHIGTLSFHF